MLIFVKEKLGKIVAFSQSLIFFINGPKILYFLPSLHTRKIDDQCEQGLRLRVPGLLGELPGHDDDYDNDDDDHHHDDDDDDDVGELPGHDAAGHLPHARRGRALDPLGATQQAGPDDQVMIMMMMMMIMILMTRENLDNYQRTGVNNVQEN